MRGLSRVVVAVVGDSVSALTISQYLYLVKNAGILARLAHIQDRRNCGAGLAAQSASIFLHPAGVACSVVSSVHVGYGPS
jgi:hypothetical protein